MALTVDVVVIGLGAIGTAAQSQLAQRGMSAVGIDRFAPPHSRGSFHGKTGVFCQAVGEAMAEHTTTGGGTPDPSAFALARFAH